MKNLFLILTFLTLSTAVWAQETTSSPWSIGVATGMDLMGSNWSGGYGLGGGSMAFGGYQLDKNWALRADAEYWILSSSGASITNPRFLALAQYTFDLPLHPYCVAGPGFDLQFATNGQSTANFDALVGLGLQLALGGQDHLFVEGRYNFTCTQNAALQDIPLLAGLWVSLP